MYWSDRVLSEDQSFSPIGCIQVPSPLSGSTSRALITKPFGFLPLRCSTLVPSHRMLLIAICPASSAASGVSFPLLCLRLPPLSAASNHHRVQVRSVVVVLCLSFPGLCLTVGVGGDGRDLLDRLGVDGRMRHHRSVVILSRSPLRRQLVQRKNRPLPPLVFPHRVISVLVQATGFERRPPCDRCARLAGPWRQCVVAQTTEPLQTTKGACANCCWNNQSSLCSFRACVRSCVALVPC